jgi:hypothetical protein
LLSLVNPCVAQNDSIPKINFHFNGYLKDWQSFSIDHVSDPTKNTYTNLNVLHNRLNLRLTFYEKFTARLELRNRLFAGDAVKQNRYFKETLDADNGFVDMSFNLASSDYYVLNINFDRASLQYSAKKTDVTVGRQRINWGVTNFWNPDDIFNTYNFLDFDYEERPGSDAIRIQQSFNEKGNADVAAAIDSGKKVTAAALYKFSKHKYDLQLAAGIYKNDFAVTTIGWAGNLKDAGFKGEANYFDAIKTDTTNYYNITAMIDYSFKNGYYINATYLYCSSGATQPMAAGNLVFIKTDAQQLMPYRHSILLQSMKQFNPILSTNISVIFSPGTQTLIIYPALIISVVNNFDVQLFTQSYYGKLPPSENFKALNNNFYLLAKWSF